MNLKSDGIQTILSCRCVKCKGLLVKDYIYTYEERLFEIRCVNCGKRTYVGELNEQKSRRINRMDKLELHRISRRNFKCVSYNV